MKPQLAFKPGVRFDIAHFDPLSLEMLRAALITAPPLIGDVMMVTSADDSHHKKGSRHYIGRAFDMRCFGDRIGGLRDLDGDVIGEEQQRDIAAIWTARLAMFLGGDYDVVLEVDHLHVELDPVLP